jgi:lipoate-protein ligase A
MTEGRKIDGGGSAALAEHPFRLSVFPSFRLWYDPTPHPAPRNMAIDQSLLDAAERGLGVLRLYRWSPPALSFGRNEPALRRYDRSRIEALGLSVVRRPTGGRAVWHANELTYAVACPADWFGDLRTAYRRIHEMLAEAVASFGLLPRLAAAPASAQPVDAGACFAAPAGGEVLVAGRKVVGSAQVRQGTALLQHGSVLLGGTQEQVAAVSAGPPAPSGETSLGAALGRAVTFEEMAAAIARTIGASLETESVPGDLSAILEAAAAHELQFSSDSWTWRR